MPDGSPRGRPASSFAIAGAGVTGPAPDESAVCSAKACSRPATWALRWNNPKIHPPDRRKVWLACDEHKGSLADFLAARKFLRDVLPFEPDRT
jgi:hypothetical protein